MAFHIHSFVNLPFYENTYVLYNDAKLAVLIDPGCITKGERDSVLQFIEKQQLQLQYIWLTHAHCDHIFGLQFFCQYFSIKPYIHLADIPVFQYAEKRAKQMNIPLQQYDGEFSFLDENTTFFEDKETIKILHIPGHSPGHVGFYNENENFIISGDVLFKNSIGRTDLEYADFQSLEQSIQQKLYTLPNQTIVYPGHNEPTLIGEEKQKNPFVRPLSLN